MPKERSEDKTRQDRTGHRRASTRLIPLPLPGPPTHDRPQEAHTTRTNSEKGKLPQNSPQRNEPLSVFTSTSTIEERISASLLDSVIECCPTEYPPPGGYIRTLRQELPAPTTDCQLQTAGYRNLRWSTDVVLLSFLRSLALMPCIVSRSPSATRLSPPPPQTSVVVGRCQRLFSP